LSEQIQNTGINFAKPQKEKDHGEGLGPKIKHKFDLREVIAPFAFLKVTQAFRDMKPGDILQLTGDDPKTRIEIFKVLHTVRYTVVDTQEEGNYYCISIKKEH
jgi:TusA-related sulfurtransferase